MGSISDGFAIVEMWDVTVIPLWPTPAEPHTQPAVCINDHRCWFKWEGACGRASSSTGKVKTFSWLIKSTAIHGSLVTAVPYLVSTVINQTMSNAADQESCTATAARYPPSPLLDFGKVKSPDVCMFQCTSRVIPEYWPGLCSSSSQSEAADQKEAIDFIPKQINHTCRHLTDSSSSISDCFLIRLVSESA